MLPQDERLRKEQDFERIFKYKCSVSTAIIIAYVSLRKTDMENNLPRVGFIVGKKIHKKSAKRNKIKRRMREAYRLIRQTNPALVEKFDGIIFIARPAILEKTYFEIKSNIITCLERAIRITVKRPC